MAIDLETLRQYVQQCDPYAPLAAGDRLYVPFDEGTPVRGAVGRSCVDALHQTIVLRGPMAETCQLFTGFPGTGKTTELRRLEARLNRDSDVPTRAILVDLEQYLDLYTPLSITDVLRVIAYVLEREALIAEGKDPDQHPGYLRRVYDFLQTEVDLKNIGFDAYGPKLMLEFKNNPTFHQKAEQALALRFQEFADEAQKVMIAAVLRIRKAAHVERIVVVADSLEKLTPLRDGDRGSMEASVEAVFLQHAALLRLPCHVIYTFPLWLRFRTVGLGARYDREPLILPMVKIVEPGGTCYEEGVAKLADVVGRRVDLEAVFGSDLGATLRPLIAASGGYPRDLLRLVRGVLHGAEAFPAGPSLIASVIDQLADDYSRVVRSTDLDSLVALALHHQLPESDGDQLAAFGRLLERWLVLAYRNGHEWYDVHPLVRRAPAVAKRLAAADKPAP